MREGTTGVCVSRLTFKGQSIGLFADREVASGHPTTFPWLGQALIAR